VRACSDVSKTDYQTHSEKLEVLNIVSLLTFVRCCVW